MSLRELTTVALRLLALWLIIATIAALPAVAQGIFWATRSLGGFQWASFAGLLLAVGGRFVLGILLFALSPRIAGFVCGGVSPVPDSERIETIRAGQLYHIATFLMGIYVVAQSFAPGARSLVAFVSETPGINSIAELVHFLAALAFGVGLMLGSRGLAQFLASLGHDPDDVPAQQFSVRAILVIVVCVAALLGLVRALVT